MQIESIKNKREITFLNIEEQDKKIEEIQTVGEIGEENNKNLRTNIGVDREVLFSKNENKTEFNKMLENAEKLTKDSLRLGYSRQKVLEDSGISLLDSEIDLVKKGIDEIIEKREFKREHLENQVEDIKQDRQDIKESSIHNIDKYIEISEAAIIRLDDSSIRQIIERGLEENIEDFYKVGTGRDIIENKPLKDELWNKDKISEILYENGINSSEKSLDMARWLFDRDFEITRENLSKLQSLKELTNLDKEERSLVIKERLREGLEYEGNPVKIPIGNSKRIEANYILATIKNLEYKDVSSRRMLEEVRLRLTEESAIRLMKKGINIDTKNLRELVENLKKEEDSLSKFFIQNEDIETGYSLEKREASLSEIIKISSYAIRGGATYRFGADLESFRYDGKISLSSYHKAGLAYEKLSTSKNIKFGDTIEKALENTDKLLESIGLNASYENKRAVRLLAYNESEINISNINTVKRVSLLAEMTLKSLRPDTVARLISNGKNPLDMEMEELFSEINEDDENREGFAKYIYNLEKKKELNNDEREILIGVYRILKQIQKTDYSVVAATSLDDKALTLRNFLKEIRQKKHLSFDKSVDESFGELERELSSKVKIDEKIDVAYSRLLAIKLENELTEVDEEYYSRVSDEIIGEIKKEDIENILKRREEFTFRNLNFQRQLREDGSIFHTLLSEFTETEKKEYRKQIEDFVEELSTEEKTLENEERIRRFIGDKIENKLSTWNDFREVVTLSNLSMGLNFIKKRSETRSYEIPLVYADNKQANLSLTIRGSEDMVYKGVVRVDIVREEGRIASEFRLIKNNLEGYVVVDNAEDFNDLKENSQNIKMELLELGLNEVRLSYHNMRIPFQSLREYSEDSSSNIDLLYKIARIISKEGLRILDK